MMDNKLLQRCEFLIWPLFVGLLYFCLAKIAIALTIDEAGFAVFWPSAGLIVAALLLSERAYWPYYLIAMAIGCCLANFSVGMSVYKTVIFTCANMCEALIAAYVIGVFGATPMSFSNLNKVIIFTLAAILATLLSALFTMILIQGDAGFFLSWFSVDLMGILIVTPLVMVLVRSIKNGYVKKMSRRDFVEMLAMLIVTLAVSILIFSQSTYPAMFVPVICVLWATYRFGLFGAVVSVAMIAAVATFYTSRGVGKLYR